MSAVGAAPQPRRRRTRFPTRLLARPTGRHPDRGPPSATPPVSPGPRNITRQVNNTMKRYHNERREAT
jgi:hypothetical protein